MDKRMILYRGSLKSCNYHCSYCPFSKHRMSVGELEKDREQWFSFLHAFCRDAAGMQVRALMIVPYGEALVHPWYWEGLAQLTALPWTDAAGAQTNLSFSMDIYQKRFVQAGGRPQKLRLWATFHPEMTTVSDFAARCQALLQAGVTLCAGAVGVPDNLALLRRLRGALPPEIYLWINRMEGLGRAYTEAEREAFLEIDPYFGRELAPVAADVSLCAQRLFVEGDGRLHTCNISPVLPGRWGGRFPAPRCGRKRCSCYLAYGGRSDFMNRMLFGDYPLFRIPRRPRAVFLDVEGTLVPGGGGGVEMARRGAADGVPDAVLAGLDGLARDGARLFLATTLCRRDAMKRLGRAGRLFQGGIFAGGAHLVWEEGGRIRERFLTLEENAARLFAEREDLNRQYGFRTLVYRSGAGCYKITLLRPVHKPWTEQEAEAVFRAFRQTECSGKAGGDKTRCLVEGSCMQIVSAQAGKAAGVRMLCQRLSIPPEKAFAFGDSPEDAEMVQICRGE